MQKGAGDGQEVAGEMQKQETGLSPFPQHTQVLFPNTSQEIQFCAAI